MEFRHYYSGIQTRVTSIFAHVFLGMVSVPDQHASEFQTAQKSCGPKIAHQVQVQRSHSFVDIQVYPMRNLFLWIMSARVYQLKRKKNQEDFRGAKREMLVRCACEREKLKERKEAEHAELFRACPFVKTTERGSRNSKHAVAWYPCFLIPLHTPLCRPSTPFVTLFPRTFIVTAPSWIDARMKKKKKGWKGAIASVQEREIAGEIYCGKLVCEPCALATELIEWDKNPRLM